MPDVTASETQATYSSNVGTVLRRRPCCKQLLDRIANRRDVAFIALDETELSAGLGISAVSRDAQEVGRRAARLAVERIARPDAPTRAITLPCSLVQRGSGELPPRPRSGRRG